MRTPKQNSERAQVSRLTAPQRRAFTLIELMVVVVIITLLSATALPGAARRFASYRLRSTAEEVAGIYRNARLRALGRGSAVLVRYNAGTFEVREAIQGTTASHADCKPLPVNSCSPAARWNASTDSVLLSSLDLSGGQLEFALSYPIPSAPTTERTNRTSLDVCFTPLGRSLADLTTAGTLETMSTVPQLGITRSGDVSIPQKVIISPLGPARAVVQ
jgi:prepilin-type N-terminal cleavage/methylation domain-containing protein